MIFSKSDKLVMIGDSITDTGRNQPVGEGKVDALGRGYVSVVDALLQSGYPELAIRVVNMGIGGNTVRDLRDRWQRDVLDLSPDWLSMMIGINDVWRQFDRPLMTESHVRLDEYESLLQRLVVDTKSRVKGIILMTPFYIEANPHDPMRAMMDRYGAAVKRIAEAHGTVFVDTQAAFARVLEHRYPAALAWDRVHPNLAGHTVLARALLDAVGFRWDADGRA